MAHPRLFIIFPRRMQGAKTSPAAFFFWFRARALSRALALSLSLSRLLFLQGGEDEPGPGHYDPYHDRYAVPDKVLPCVIFASDLGESLCNISMGCR